MGSAKMTLIGMYQYDNTLFNEAFLPQGIDKDLFIDALMMQGGEFEVLYPNPDFMKKSIKVWCSKWYRTFAEWLKGTQAEWNPIYNYDRYEDTRDELRKVYNSKTTADYSDNRTLDLTDERTADLKETRTADMQDKRTADLTEETTFDNKDTTTQIMSGETEHKVSAYDASDYQDSSKDIINNGVSELDHSGSVSKTTTGTDTNTTSGMDTNATTGTDKNTHSGTDNLNRVGTLEDVGGNEDNTNMHTAHMYGNIGVTTSAAMLKEFYDIAKWNLYEHMCDVFISELLLAVY